MTDPQPPSTPIDDVIVIGTRAVAGPLGSGGGGGGPGEPGVEQNEVEDGNGQGPSGLTPEEAEAENKRQQDCAAKRLSENSMRNPTRTSANFSHSHGCATARSSPTRFAAVQARA